ATGTRTRRTRVPLVSTPQWCPMGARWQTRAYPRDLQFVREISLARLANAGMAEVASTTCASEQAGGSERCRVRRRYVQGQRHRAALDVVLPGHVPRRPAVALRDVPGRAAHGDRVTDEAVAEEPMCVRRSDVHASVTDVHVALRIDRPWRGV